MFFVDFPSYRTFQTLPGGTEMKDTVDYALPFGLFGAIAHWLFVRRTLERIFDYRAAAIQRTSQGAILGLSSQRVLRAEDV
ncbi:hypothetical protein [Edaphobacter modestus]|uniref:hypothetical protein n=1 Tax=Edaphobacter modestus TaxID=388466 RepID=UPI0013EE50A8|nr:hypothetical protein [Edaphobacter modestus]